MKLTYIRIAVPVAALLTLTGCIDDSYDLSDIDTTTQLKANELTVPINLDPIKLDNMIDLDDDDPDAAITIVNGKYAVKKGGSFHASTTVAKVKAGKANDINPTKTTIHASQSAARRAGSRDLSFPIPDDMETSFNYHVTNVDDAIRSIQDIKISPDEPMLLNITISVPELAASTSSLEIDDLEIAIPNGIVASYGSVKSSNGKIVIPSISGSASAINVALKITEADLAILTNNKKGIEVKDHQFNFAGNLGVIGGTLHANAKNSLSTSDIPSSATLYADYNMSGFTVEYVSGEIHYEIDMSPITPVDISDLPDFLSDDQTNLILENPQIYLTIDNPVARYGLDCKSGITIQGTRAGDASSSAQILDSFNIASSYGAQSNILLAPKPDTNDLEVANVHPVVFSSLGMVLASDNGGIPERLDIELASEYLPKPLVEGMAKDFQLGVPMRVEGNYTFFTNLALAQNSVIFYSKQEDGWSDGEVDAIRVEKFKVTAVADNELPFGATLVAHPVILLNGEPVPNTDITATAELATGNDQPFTLEFDGIIEHLDGIKFTAKIVNFTGEALAPEQTITIRDIRATVTGTYTKEL